MTVTGDRLMYLAKLFVVAAYIGFLALLYFVGLLLASVIASTPSRGWWIISFAFTFVALCTHVAAWLVLFCGAAGFGVSNPFLFWQYPVRASCPRIGTINSVCVSRLRYLAFDVLMCDLLVSLRIVPLWVPAIRALSGSSRSDRA